MTIQVGKETQSSCPVTIDEYGCALYFLYSFDFYFLFIKCKRVKLSHSFYCLLPVDSSMSLSVTECNWFCQGQSIAPRQASSAGDKGCITVNLYSAYRNDAVCLCMGVSKIEIMIWLKNTMTWTLADPVTRWNAATGAKPTDHHWANLQKMWELSKAKLTNGTCGTKDQQPKRFSQQNLVTIWIFQDSLKTNEIISAKPGEWSAPLLYVTSQQHEDKLSSARTWQFRFTDWAVSHSVRHCLTSWNVFYIVSCSVILCEVCLLDTEISEQTVLLASLQYTLRHICITVSHKDEVY